MSRILIVFTCPACGGDLAEVALRQAWRCDTCGFGLSETERQRFSLEHSGTHEARRAYTTLSVQQAADEKFAVRSQQAQERAASAPVERRGAPQRVGQ